MRIQRIVIAIDASPTSLAALEATADLAARWDAEILGIFVEDTNLLRMASLPFAGEVGSHSGSFRAINTNDIKRQIKSQAERARQFARLYCDLMDRGENYPTAEKFFVGKGLIWSNSTSGGDSGRAGWDALRGRLLTPLRIGGHKQRLAYEDGNRWHLTPTGKRLLRQIATAPAPPDT